MISYIFPVMQAELSNRLQFVTSTVVNASDMYLILYTGDCFSTVLKYASTAVRL